MGKRVAIIGAGPAGIVTAIALKKHGYEPTLYDKIDPVIALQWLLPPSELSKPQYGSSGGTLSLYGNGLRALQFVGLSDSIEALRSVPTSKMIFALQDGSDRNTRTLAKPGDIEPLHVLRSEFHAILMKAAYTHGIKTLAGKKFVSLQEKGPEVVINFADGSLVTADFVIGADGVHSAVRKCIFPDAPLPIVCGRGFVGEVELGQYANGITAQFDDPKALHMDPIGGHSFYHCTYAPNSVSFDIISFNHPDQELPLNSNENTDWSPVKNLSEERENLARDVESWGFKRNIVDNIRVAKQLTPLIVLDLPDLPQYYSSRVVLIGDAAHGILPTNGQGLNLALEDAGTLGDLFGHFKNALDPVPRVFELYEKIRKPHVQGVSKHSRMIASRMRAKNQLELRIGRLMMRIAFMVQEMFGGGDAMYNHNYRDDIVAAVPDIKFV